MASQQGSADSPTIRARCIKAKVAAASAMQLMRPAALNAVHERWPRSFFLSFLKTNHAQDSNCYRRKHASAAGVATEAATATTLRQRLLASQGFQSHSCLERG